MSEEITANSPTPPPLTKKSTWPLPVGIIAIVFGLGATIMGLLAPAAAKLSESMLAMSPDMELPEGMMEAQALQGKMGLIGAPIALLLVVGGIFLLMRKPLSRPLLLGWAVLKILFAVISTVVGIKVSKKMMDSMAAQMQTEGGPDMGGVMGAFANVGAIMGLFWYLALPIFILVWFFRAAIKQEVASWGQQL